MAAGCFEVDADALKRDVGTLRQYLQNIDQAHSELQNKVAELGNMWEGPAKEAFHLQFQKDCAELTAVCQEIREVLDSMDAAAQEYNSCDGRVRAIIDAIQV